MSDRETIMVDHEDYKGQCAALRVAQMAFENITDDEVKMSRETWKVVFKAEQLIAEALRKAIP